MSNSLTMFTMFHRITDRPFIIPSVQSSKALIAKIFYSFSEMGKCSKIFSRHFVQTHPLNNLASRVDWTLNSFRPAFIIA